MYVSKLSLQLLRLFANKYQFKTCSLYKYRHLLDLRLKFKVVALVCYVVPKHFAIAYHLWVQYCHHVPPFSRKTQSTKYHPITSLES